MQNQSTRIGLYEFFLGKTFDGNNNKSYTEIQSQSMKEFSIVDVSQYWKILGKKNNYLFRWGRNVAWITKNKFVQNTQYETSVE